MMITNPSTITIANNMYIDTVQNASIDRGIFEEWFPRLLIGEHTAGDECFCRPYVHEATRTIIHHNPKLLGVGYAA